jgi:elongation of very long chain fatty acids protein 4
MTVTRSSSRESKDENVPEAPVSAAEAATEVAKAPTMLEAENMFDFATALLRPVVSRFGLAPERMFLPIGLCTVHTIFMAMVWFTLSEQQDPAAYMQSWLSLEWPTLLAGCYLLIVFVGPKVITAPVPDLKEAMVVYNLYQTAINAVMVGALFGGALLRGLAYAAEGKPMLLWEQPVEGTPALIVFGLFCHYNNKFVEYLDTIFMVLRQKNDQMTFLHCWHHFLMGFAWWCVLRHAAGGAAWYGSGANSLIHVIMYGYYGATSLGFKLPGWMKMFVTQSQLIQFCLVASQSVWMLYRHFAEGVEVYPSWLTLLQLAVMVNMFVMFAGFYARQYCKRRSSEAKKAKQA